MKESVAITIETDTKKGISPSRSDKSIHRARNEPERQLVAQWSAIINIRSDGSTPSIESIATQLSSMLLYCWPAADAWQPVCAAGGFWDSGEA